ncbi:MAG: cell division protein FtsZ [Chloroflexi bacterium RBG_13_54_8]|nr:MAG: cell division protein FtsZ [Chloroflexi bacterium RBG_13_54_8]
MVKDSFVHVPVRIRAIGVGGGGCNAINRMVRSEVHGVEFIAVNSDVQALMANEARSRVQIGRETCRGMGAGGDPERGRQAVEENLAEIREVVKGAQIVFVAAGMGGGTGTGAAPVVAKLARESGALTIGIVTTPFKFEMARRMRVAEEGLAQLGKEADAMIVIPNERLLSITDGKTTVDGAFQKADDVLMTGVRAISEVITVPGLINLDFADVNAIMKNAGPCRMAIGSGSGRNRMMEAAQAAVTSDLLGTPIDGATGVLYVVSGPPELTLAEVGQAAQVIQGSLHQEAMVIFGVTIDPKLGGNVAITLVATGFAPIEKMTKQRKDEEFRRVIDELEEDESQLEAPAFKRRPVSMRQISGRP